MSKSISSLTTEQSTRVSNSAYAVLDLLNSSGNPQETVKAKWENLPTVLGIQDGVSVWKTGKQPQVYLPDADTDAARGTAFLAAHAAAASGDTVHASPGVYDLAGTFSPTAGVRYRAQDCVLYKTTDDTALISVPVADAEYWIEGGHWDNRGLNSSSAAVGFSMPPDDDNSLNPVCHFYPQSVKAAGEQSATVYLAQGTLIGHADELESVLYDCLWVAGSNGFDEGINTFVHFSVGTATHRGTLTGNQSNGVEVSGTYPAAGSISIDHIRNYGSGPSVNLTNTTDLDVRVGSVTIYNLDGSAVQLNANCHATVNACKFSSLLGTSLNSGIPMVKFVGADNYLTMDSLLAQDGIAVDWGTSSRCQLFCNRRTGTFTRSGVAVNTVALFENVMNVGSGEMGNIPTYTSAPALANVEEWARYNLVLQSTAADNGLYYHNAESGALEQLVSSA